MKCWSSAFNAQGSRVIIVVIEVEVVKIYVAALKALRTKERGDETQFTTKIGGKTSFESQLFRFVKIVIPSYTFDALLCWNWQFSPPNRVTLALTLLFQQLLTWKNIHGVKIKAIIFW